MGCVIARLIDCMMVNGTSYLTYNEFYACIDQVSVSTNLFK